MIDYSLQRVWKVSENDFINCGIRLALDISMFAVTMLVIEKINEKKYKIKETNS